MVTAVTVKRSTVPGRVPVVGFSVATRWSEPLLPVVTVAMSVPLMA